METLGTSITTVATCGQFAKTANRHKKERERLKEVSFNQTERLEINLSEITQALPRAMSSQPQPNHAKEHAFKRVSRSLEFQQPGLNAPKSLLTDMQVSGSPL